MQKFKKKLRDIEAKERASNIKDTDNNQFIIALKEPVELNLISPEDAQKLIEAVQKGHISLKEAYRLIQEYLEFDN